MTVPLQLVSRMVDDKQAEGECAQLRMRSGVFGLYRYPIIGIRKKSEAGVGGYRDRRVFVGNRCLNV